MKVEGRKKGTTKELLKKIRCIQRIMKRSAIDLQGLRASDKLTGCEDDFKKAGLKESFWKVFLKKFSSPAATHGSDCVKR